MSSFTVVALCIQACLIQTVLSNLYGQNINLGNRVFNQASPSLNTLNVANAGLGAINVGTNNALNSASAGSCAQYGGSGTGQVGVAGDIGACGSTVVVGSVPVLGSVDFSGCVPAAGTVSISGQCGCGCNA